MVISDYPMHHYTSYEYAVRQYRQHKRNSNATDKFDIIKHHIQSVRTYATLNGIASDQWFIGNAYHPGEVSEKYDLLHDNKTFLFETPSPAITSIIINHLVAQHGYQTDHQPSGGHTWYYIFRILTRKRCPGI